MKAYDLLPIVLEGLLGRLARKTCLGDVFGIIARILAKRTPFWTAHEGIDTIRAKDVSIAMATQVISFVVVGTHTAKGNLCNNIVRR